MRLVRDLCRVTALLAVAAGVPGSLAAQVGLKIGYVDSRAVLQATPGYAAADSQFSKELESYRNEVQRLQASLDSAAREFEQSSLVLTPSAREAKRKELVNQQGVLEKRASDLDQRASNRQRELLDPIERRVNAAIEAVRAAGNYAMIFDVGSASNSIVAADKSLDLTQLVIDHVKKGGS